MPFQWLNLLLCRKNLVQTEIKRIVPSIRLLPCINPFLGVLHSLIMTNFMWNCSRHAILDFQTSQPAPSITLPSAPFMTSGSCLWADDALRFYIYVEILPRGNHCLRSVFYEIQTWNRALPDLFSITHSLLSWMTGTFLIIDGWIDSLAAASIFVPIRL